MIIKLKCLVLILVITSCLFADNLLPKSKWQFYNEYAKKDNVVYVFSDNHESKFPIYLKEFGYALGGSTCCVGSGIGASLLVAGILMSDERRNLGVVFGLSVVLSTLPFILTPVGAAWGTFKAAKEIDPGGSFWVSCFGATAGLIVGGGLGFGSEYVIHKTTGGDRNSSWPYWWLTIPLAFLGNSIGAVIGYNLSLPRKFRPGYLYQHFDPPSFCMKTEKTQEGKTITAVNFRLINARF